MKKVKIEIICEESDRWEESDKSKSGLEHLSKEIKESLRFLGKVSIKSTIEE